MVFQFIGAGFNLDDSVYNDHVFHSDEFEARIHFNDQLDDQRYIHQVLIEVHSDGRWRIIDQVANEGKSSNWFVSDKNGQLTVDESNLQKVLKKRI